MMDMEMMNMYFYQSVEAVYIFKDWKTETTGQYVMALLATFLMAFAIEGLNFWKYSI